MESAGRQANRVALLVVSLSLLGAGTSVEQGPKPKNEAYLFAHMMKGDYRRAITLRSASTVFIGLCSTMGKAVSPVAGHASIARGHDGRYYLVGNNGDDAPDINFWVSDDLMSWKMYSDCRPDVTSAPNYAPLIIRRIGAPKLYSTSRLPNTY